MRKTLLLIFVASMSLSVGAAQKPVIKRISIDEGKFTPAALSVAVNEKVQWSNDDDKDHSIEADDGSFASGKLKAGQKFEYKFSKEGTYSYHCKLHPREKAKVTVK